MRMKTRVLTQFALLTSVALVLGWLDRMIPLGVPGLRLGLGNVVLLYALYLMNRKSALVLMLLKVFLSGFLFSSSGWTILISFSGGVCSLCIMLLLQLFKKLDVVIVSTGGALFHVLGQLLVIVLARMAPWAFILGYLPILGIASVLTGVLTGLVAKYALRAMRVIQKTDGGKPPAKAHEESSQ